MHVLYCFLPLFVHRSIEFSMSQPDPGSQTAPQTSALQDIGGSEGFQNNNITIHAVPATIKYRGAANIEYVSVTVSMPYICSKYFVDYPADDFCDPNPCPLRRSMRGHALMGKEVPLPKGYNGIVLEESSAGQWVARASYAMMTTLC